MGDSKVRNENYIVIQGWMRNDLNLKGNELLVYAVIYGFSQKENQWFEGSRQYLADWAGATRQGIDKNLKSLLEKGLIEKQENVINNVKFVCYRATEFTGGSNSVYKGSQHGLQGMETEFIGGSQHSLHNNIDIKSIENNTKVNNRGYKPVKHKHGEYNNVLLTDEEYQKLQDMFPDLQDRIERLSEYVASTGKSYKSHYATIRAWARKDKKPVNKASKELDDFYSMTAEWARSRGEP